MQRSRETRPRIDPGYANLALADPSFDWQTCRMVCSMTFCIRQAEREDAARLRDIYEASIRSLARRHYTPSQIQTWATSRSAEQFRWAIEHDELFLLAEQSAQAMGYVSLLDDEVRSLYVDPSAARRGVGSALLRAATWVAQERGLKAVSLHAASNAVPFYEANGFRGSEPVRLLLHDGQHLETLKMQKPI